MKSKVFFALILIIAVIIVGSAVIISPARLALFGYKGNQGNSEVGKENPTISAGIPTFSISGAQPSQETNGSTTAPQSSTGITITFESLTFILPPSVASGANGSEIPRLDSEGAAWWQKTPGHLQVMFGDYYVLQGKFHQPRIYVYPAEGYAEMVPAAFEAIHRLTNILAMPGTSISAEQLPNVPFFSAQAVFASNIEKISFENGTGVRFLTGYTQSNAPINNYEWLWWMNNSKRA